MVPLLIAPTAQFHRPVGSPPARLGRSPQLARQLFGPDERQAEKARSNEPGSGAGSKKSVKTVASILPAAPERVFSIPTLLYTSSKLPFSFPQKT
ncbi:hypothetical protein SBV1_2460003 [Verrucomicrobia bacterium]|nr:hypothetical protein SBV1_2460003 [Verrucomicrobiota bacterium]